MPFDGRVVRSPAPAGIFALGRADAEVYHGRALRGAISTEWGKLSDDGGTRTWHPLVDHCADVAACAEALLRGTLLGARLARWGGLDALDELQIARLSALAALHDIGKYNRGFQAKSGEQLKSPYSTAGHVREILALFGDGFGEETERLVDALPIAELERWGEEPETACRLLTAAIGHHGRPHPCQAFPGFNPRIWHPGPLGDPFAGVAELVASVRRWFPLAFESGGRPLPMKPAFQHGFAGLVMLADWVGSHRELFPYSEELRSSRMIFARARAQLALGWIGLDGGSARRSLGAHRPGFSTISPYPSPQPVQSATGALPLEPGGSLTIIEAETGSGKTEAALLRYAQLFQAGLVDGLYFALPTRTAATQIHARVLEAVTRAFPEGERPPVLLAVPGYLRVDDDEGRRLPDFQVLWNDDASERMRFRGWAAENSKRYLAGSVVVGTIDQVLLSTVMTSHAHLRATALSRLLLVVDEVHASDVYMNRLLQEVLQFHVAAEGHSLLMSATLGASARARLLGAVGARGSLPSPSEATSLPYPMLTYYRPGRAVDELGITRGERSKRVRPLLLRTADDPQRIAERALAAARQGARVLIVRNTVRDCVDTQTALEEEAVNDGDRELLFRVGDVLAPHHSRFAALDRRLLDQQVEAEFGKVRTHARGCVLVATQTVEQSLDLDADLLLTDLCPMDVLLQRVGRLHRHARPANERPRQFRAPTVGVLVPPQRDLGSRLRHDGRPLGPHGHGTVYRDLRVLEATWRCCEQREVFDIPADNRALVEAATHPTVLKAITSSLGDAWERHNEWLIGNAVAERGVARSVLVDRSVEFGEARFVDKDQLGKVASRLGDDDRAIKFEEPVMSPFHLTIQGVVLPAYMLRNPPDDPLAPIAATTIEGGLTFRYGGADYLYDRRGLRPAPTMTTLDREGEDPQ